MQFAGACRGFGPALGTSLALAVAMAGCGDSGTDPTEKAESTVATLLETCARGEGEAVLGLLTPPSRALVIEAESVIEGCERVLELGVGLGPGGREAFRQATIRDVVVRDDLGTATIEAPAGNTIELELENTGGRWLVSNPPL